MKLRQASARPPKALVLTPDSFADTWDKKPERDVAIGLRLVSELDLELASAEAAKIACDLHDDSEGQTEAYNNALICQAVARGTCDVNDVKKACPFFPFGDEDVRSALTPEGARRIWDELVVLHRSSSPAESQIDDDDLGRLGVLLASHSADALDPQMRRLLHFVLRELPPAPEAAPTPTTGVASMTEF